MSRNSAVMAQQANLEAQPFATFFSSRHCIEALAPLPPNEAFRFTEDKAWSFEENVRAGGSAR